MRQLMNTIVAAALTLALVSSCVEEMAGPDTLSGGETVLEACIEATSRAALEGNRIIWQEGDEINVITKASKNCGAYVLTAGAGTTTASFRGSDIPESAEYYALYPHQSGMTKSNSRYRFSIPQDQTWQDGTVGRGANIMVAVFTDKSQPLQFRNVMGLLKLSLTGNVKAYKISVTDKDESNMLWGKAGLLLDGTQGTASQSLELTEGDNCLNLLCPDGVQLSSVATTFYIAVPPGSFSQGMSVKVYGANTSVPLDEFSTAKDNAIIRSEVRTMPVRNVIPDLSLEESANCYPIYIAGDYKFKAVKGNGSESVNGIAGASVLWETRNTATAPTAGSIISNASYSDGYISFTASGLTGNAVIAAKDAADNILWSWHIWIPGSEIEPLERASNFLMDRNLGALYSGHPTQGDGTNTIGLFYEWGRKDPFPASTSWSASGLISTAATTGEAFSASARTAESGTVAWAIAHPQNYLFCPSGTDADQDWLYSHDNTLWAATKTIYDPCPAGYHLAGWKDWYTCPATFDESGTWFGADINYYGNNVSWFPIGGYRFASDGANHASGYQAYYWSYDVNGNKSRAAMIKPSSTSPVQSSTVGRSLGANVRCIADTRPADPIVPKEEAGSTTNVQGTVTCAGSPVSGVVVSDGVEVAVTDDEGHYELASKKEKGYVFVSVPSGYIVPTEGANAPLFWKKTTKSASLLETIDFTLIRQEDQSKFKLIAIGDIQVNNLQNGDDIRQFNEVFAPDFQDYLQQHSGEKIFVLTMGDLSWNDYWADHNFNMDDYKAMFDAKVQGVQVFNTPGNHDNDRGQDGVFPTNNDESKAKYRSLFGPSNYSFNIGAYHIIVLDNVWCYNLGKQDGTKRRGTMSYKFYITDEQLEWISKDLAYVPAETPLFISGHCNFHKIDGTARLVESSVPKLISRLGGRRTWLLSGHTHDVYNVDRLAECNVFEHNCGGLAGATWHKNGFSLTPGGAPCGYKIFDVDGTSVSWIYKNYKESEENQFRIYDRNCISLNAADWIPNCTSEDARLAWETRVSWYLAPSTDNIIVVNVWDWDPEWTVEILEGNTPLEVEMVSFGSGTEAERRDPLFMATFEYQYFDANKTDAGTFRAGGLSHIFRAQASSATSTVTVRVTNRFGRVFTKTIQRPYAFSVTDYNP